MIRQMMGALALGWAVAATPSAGLAADVAIPRPEHPTPDVVRPHWANLNGTWDFRFDPKDEGNQKRWQEPGAAGFDRAIVVPFGWESELSGVRALDGAAKVGWYRREFAVPASFPADEKVHLHFGAVDYRADVWVNGKAVATHEGGYAPFSADVTAAVKREGANTVVVRAFDPTDPELPTGKQIGWYTPTSGIWQTVWLESRPEVSIAGFTIRTEIAPPSVSVRAEFAAVNTPRSFGVVGTDPGLVGTAVQIPPGATSIQVDLPIASAKLWSPESPHLYDLTLELKDAAGHSDRVATYFGLRTIARGRFGDAPYERLLFNGKPLYLRAALDQSFNPKGIYTAPTDDFLRADIELSKKLGLNALRIHIKPDEPRRLYWADKLGLLIMEDMANTWDQSPKARKAWEAGMREIIPRDRNHPSIFSWVAFNETWGLGHPQPYKADTSTQEWVKAMVAEVRKLDPTRLVEDNSPCYYDHIEGSDLNSWHFYIEDHRDARAHIEDVVAKTVPGSSFNFCPGRVQGTAPLINSEYGGISAGGGDRDVSWAFRDLTTQLRRHDKIQGYVYTELSDIEWEHNGFVNYDRSPKDFGYDAFVPGMTPADLQGADFIGYDAPPAIVAKPGEAISLPLFVSHYSERAGAPTLRWAVAGVDGSGRPVAKLPSGERKVTWAAYNVTNLEPLQVKAPDGPFVGAIALVLEDGSGRKIAANFVNLVVRPAQAVPLVERASDREATLRFAPDDFSGSRWSGTPTVAEGKAYGEGSGYFEYRLALPEAVAKAKPESIAYRFELSSKAGVRRVDWPEHPNAQDNPQTDVRRWPSYVAWSINGRALGGRPLDDDPADARGVLSHLRADDHGSYGDSIEGTWKLDEATRAELAAGKPLVLRLTVPGGTFHPAGGLCLFGADTGRFPFDPTLVVTTAEALPGDLGTPPDKSPAIDTVASRRERLIPSGDSARPATWAYTTADPGPMWASADFDDASWKRGQAGFGGNNVPALKINTPWTTPTIWLRTAVDMPAPGADDVLTLHLFHDEDVDVYINGQVAFRAKGYVSAYRDVALDAKAKALFRPGKNAIAVRCRQTGGGQGVDVGLELFRDGGLQAAQDAAP